MFMAIITCAALVSCGLTGEFHSRQRHATAETCRQMTRMALELIGEEPARFRIRCVRAE